MPLAIIAHGGAWDIPGELHAEHLESCRAAAEAGWDLLRHGGTALEAVEAAVRVHGRPRRVRRGPRLAPERRRCGGAGRGHHGRRDTRARVRWARSRRIANPITLARHVLHHSPHVFLVGEGAERFAEQMGMTLCDPEDLVVPRERALWERKRQRNRGGATLTPSSGPARPIRSAPSRSTARGTWPSRNSTGGTFFKHPGRVGRHADHRLRALCR